MQAIQIGATKVLSMLLMLADVFQQYVHGSSLGLDDKEVWFVRTLLLSFSIFWVKGKKMQETKKKKKRIFLMLLICECNS